MTDRLPTHELKFFLLTSRGEGPGTIPQEEEKKKLDAIVFVCFACVWQWGGGLLPEAPSFDVVPWPPGEERVSWTEITRHPILPGSAFRVASVLAVHQPELQKGISLNPPGCSAQFFFPGWDEKRDLDKC